MTKKQNVQLDAQKGAAIYSKTALAFYDFLVLGFSNRFLWQCRTSLLLDNYNQHVGLNHLDVGVGTGYFLDHCQFPKSASGPHIHLLDLNPNTLEVTAKRIHRYHPKTHLVNILEPLTLSLPPFDSIAVNYLLHCLPGNMQHKEIVFKNLVPLLNKNGFLFGSTILGKNINVNFLARKLMQFYNSKGIFSNTDDDLASLKRVLGNNLREFRVKVVGCVAIFYGRV